MKAKMMVIWLTLMCLSFFISAPPIHSYDDEGARLSLKGLQEIFVLIEELSPAFKELGLTEYQLRTDVELKLRMAGIKVVSEKDKVPGTPFLYVKTWGERSKNLPDSFSILFVIELQQKVFLFRIPNSLLWAPTWSLTQWGLIPDREFSQRIRATVKDSIDMFINAYLSVNPKGEK
jgi:hypothetical protein